MALQHVSINHDDPMDNPQINASLVDQAIVSPSINLTEAKCATTDFRPQCNE